ncbi:MAG: ADP-forming succinate--CoA ligase subunit beta [Deltaproteobacteria bacterium]|nr:ADP-forming succinate--CoA ligase subunit beta [Deltaproteobacteria bacterium]
MKIHEYQAKDILRQSGVPVPDGQVVTSPDEALKASQIIGGNLWVVKAQVHAGGRGKGGGVKVVNDPSEVVSTTELLLKTSLVTPQTGPDGVNVNKVLVEQGVNIEKELYLGMVIDRKTERPAMIFSQAGGMDIEEVAKETPELIWKEYVDPATGWLPYQSRNLIYRLDPIPAPAVVKQLMSVMAKIYHVFVSLDCSLVEINPLVITKEDQVFAVDAKMNLDDNALFRHKELLALDDPSEEDPLDLMAKEYNLNYIRLDGNIGAMVNGAGLAMATLDLIKAAGAEPANFLDAGGGANEEMIAKGFEIILKDPRVKAILVNIFGGILRCDVLARGVVAAAQKNQIAVPLIVRLEGTNVEEGRKILEESDLSFLLAKDLAEAADHVAEQVKGKD